MKSKSPLASPSVSKLKSKTKVSPPFKTLSHQSSMDQKKTSARSSPRDFNKVMAAPQISQSNKENMNKPYSHKNFMNKEVIQKLDPKESPNPTTFSNMRSFDYLSGNSPK